MGFKNWRVWLTLIFIVVSVIAFWDTFKLWTMTPEEKLAMSETDPGGMVELQKKAIRLGLDLQGGIHVVLRVKLEELDEAARQDAVERAIQIIRNRVDGLGVTEPQIQKQGNDRIIVDLPGYTDVSRAEELIGQTALLEFKLLETPENANLILARIDSVVTKYRDANNDADADVVKGADTTKTQDEKTNKDTTDILSELMGDTSKDTADEFAFDESTALTDDEHPFTSRLDPILFNSSTGLNWPGFAVSRNDKPLLEKWLSLPEVKAQIPIDVQFGWSTRSEIRNQREVFHLYLLKRKVQFVGKYLEGINTSTDSYGAPVVNFKLSGDGAALFSQLTGSNINKPLAITLDERVQSAPFINSKIRNDGQITLGSSATFENARDLEIVLKAGALPAPVEIIEKFVVGATLGADSIKKGLWSSIIGLILVLVYIGVYYRISGIIADIGLLFNIFFLLAVLAAFGATLTMPGIAGIILTIGMSLDSNILIFERIREELRTGKTVHAAIDAGYDRAFAAIFDTHVTTLITAGALFLLGSGPIKGFAVTLFWGVTISLYTAYIITKQIFDIRKTYKTLSI